MLLLGTKAIRHQQPVLTQLRIELLVLSLPPLLTGLSQHSALALSEVQQQLSLFTSQVVQNSLVRGQLQLLIFLVLSQFGVIAIHNARWNFGSLDHSRSSSGMLQITFQRSYSCFELLNKVFFPLDVLLDDILVRSFFRRQFLKFALVFGMNDVIFFGERIFSESLDVMGTQIPFIFIRYVFSSYEILVIAHW